MDNNIPQLSDGYYRGKFFQGDKVNLMVLPQMAVVDCVLPNFIGKYVVISIAEPNIVVHFDKKNPNLVNYLRLGFSDRNRPIPRWRVFKKSDAIKLLDFVNKNIDDIDTIVVHCHAGCSRSAGLACILSKIYNNQESWFWENPELRCNTLVYKVTLEYFNETVDKDKRLQTVLEEDV